MDFALSSRTETHIDVMKDLQRVADFHKRYEKEVLLDRLKKKQTYLSNDKEALFFIFSLCFYQGRKDSLSQRFEKYAVRACDQYFKHHPSLFSQSAGRLLKKTALKSKYQELMKTLDDHGVSKGNDRLMVISLINLIQSNHQKNIVQHLVDRVKGKEIPGAHRELESVWSIGPKIASLILRDIVYIYDLEKHIEDKETYQYLQPVDTWVHQLAKRLKIIDPNIDKPYDHEPRDITGKCLSDGVNPIHFNQGAWYLGSHAVDLILENLDRISS